MRDPNRIYEVIAEVQRVWAKYPDMRFCQLMDNLLNMYYNETQSDPFYLEDVAFVEWLQKKYKEN